MTDPKATTDSKAATPASPPSTEELSLLKSLLAYAVASVPTVLEYADKVPVVSSAVKSATPVLEPYAKTILAYSEPVAVKIDEKLSVAYHTVKDTAVMKSLSSKLEKRVSAPHLPPVSASLSDLAAALLELSDGQVDYWLPSDADSKEIAEEKASVGSVAGKVSKRLHKKLDPKLDELKLKIAASTTFALNTLETSKEVGAQIYAAPVEWTKVKYEESAAAIGMKKEELSKFLEEQRAVLVQKYSDILESVPLKDEITKRAGDAVEKFKGLKASELKDYASSKLTSKSAAPADTATAAKTEEVEVKVLEFLHALGKVVFLEELLAKGEAFLKSSPKAASKPS